MILDAGVLVAIDRGEDSARAFLESAERSARPLHTTATVAAQVWRHGSRQARLAKALSAMTVHPFRTEDVARVGETLRRSGTSDVVDAHLVVVSVRLGYDIITSDTDDFAVLAAHLPAGAPTARHWM